MKYSNPVQFLSSDEGNKSAYAIEFGDSLLNKWLPRRSRVSGVFPMSAGIAWKMHCGRSEREATVMELQYRLELACDVDRKGFRSVYPEILGM